MYMKAFLLKSTFTILILLGFVNGAWAQTDVTSAYLTNADFSSTDGWTAVVSSDYKDYGNGLIGDYIVRINAATVDDTHLATEYCFGFECRWKSNYASFNQETTENLPIGVYTLTYDVENVNSATTKAYYNNLFYVKVGNVTYSDNNTEWMKGKSSWTKHTITFTVTEPAKTIVSLGYGTGNNDFKADNTPAIYVSHLKLTKIETLPYAAATKKPIYNESTTAADFATMLRSYYESNAKAEGVEGAEDMTTKLTNVSDPANTNGWIVANTNGNSNMRTISGESYTDADGTNNHTYFDSNSWGSAFATTFSQNVTLPQGKYLFTAKARGNGTTLYKVFADDISTDITTSGNQGGMFDKGWSDYSVEFEEMAEKTVKLGVQIETSNASNWVSFSDFRLTRIGDVEIAAPTFSLEAGTYDEEQTVTLASEVEGASIYYTLDGTTPSANSTLYTKSIFIDKTTTVKAIAIVGDLMSDVAEADYVIEGTAFGESILLTNDMFYRWDGYGADASHISTATVDSNFGQELSAGNTLVGTSTVDYLTYADLTGYSKMQFEGTSGTVLRVLMNRQESNSGPLDERLVTIDDNGNAELDLTEFDYVHLNAIKINWGSSGTVTAIKLQKPIPGEKTTIFTVDYSSLSTYPYHRMDAPEGSSYDVIDGNLQIQNTVEQTNAWDFQPFIADGITLKDQYGYIVRITYNSTASSTARISLGTWNDSMSKDIDLVASDEFQTANIVFPKFYFSANNAHILMQCGKYVGTLNINKVEVIEIEPEEPVQDPVYINLMVNGNCASDDCVIGNSEGAPVYSMLCKEYDSNPNVNIEEGAGFRGSRAAIVRTVKDNTLGNNAYQFFVTTNHKFKAGEKYLFRMKYKADKEAKITTEAHVLPFQWRYWAMLGDLNATTVWQTFEKYGYITDEQDGMQTIAFNLYNLKDDNTYYFDDIEFYINQYDATEQDLADAERVKLEGPDGVVIVDGVRQKPQPGYSSFVTDKEMYLYNIGAEAYFTEGNKYGTQASIGKQGLKVKFEQDEDGIYLFNDYSLAKGGWNRVFFANNTEMYVDLNWQEDYYWEVEDNGDGTFRLLASSKNPTFDKESYQNYYVGLNVNENPQNTALSPFLQPGSGHYIDWTMISQSELDDLNSRMELYNKAQRLKEKIDYIESVNGDVSDIKAVYLNKNATMAELDAALEVATKRYIAAYIDNAPDKNNVDVTMLLVNPDFEAGETGWTVEAAPGSGANGHQGNVRPGGSNNNQCYEAWNNSSFDIYQEVSGVPVGVYEIQVQGFYRYGRGDYAWNAYLEQNVDYVKPNGVPVYVYMNNNATNFVNVYGDPKQITDESFYSNGSTDYASQWKDGTLNYFPDGMASAAIAFSDGMYKQSAYGLVASEGDVMRLGVKGNSSQLNDSWVIWDDFKLIYRGFNPDVIKPVLETAMNDVREYMGLLMGKTEYAALSTAFADAEAAIENNDGEAMFAALNALYIAKDPARISKDIFLEAEIAADTTQLAGIVRYMSDKKLNKQTFDNATALLSGICKNELYENDETDLLKSDVSEMIDSLSTSYEKYNEFKNAIDGYYNLVSGVTEEYEVVTETRNRLATYLTEYEEGSVNNEDIQNRIDTLESFREPLLKIALLTFISQAETITDIGKELSSYAYLQDVIASLKEFDINQLGEKEINELGTELTEALNNLALRPGYSYLTPELFKIWDKCDAADVTEQGNGYSAYNLMVPTDMVYGHSSVMELFYADLSNYDRLYIPVSAGTPRILMNRTEANGRFSEDKELSKLLEMPQDGSWTDAYYTMSDDSIRFTYDLAKIVEENGFAHLNAIKNAYYQPVTVSEMLLFNSKNLVAEVDYSKLDNYPYNTINKPEGTSFNIVNGVLEINNTSDQLNAWDFQTYIINWFNIKKGYDYIVRFTYKSTAAGKVNITFGTRDFDTTKYDVNIDANDSFTTVDVRFPSVTCPTENNNGYVVWHGGSIVGTVQISKVEVIQILSEDPLFDAKVELSDEIAKAEMKTNFGKTEDSFAALTAALNNAKTVLGTATSEDELIDALIELNNSVHQLRLLPGYTYLTQSMFQQWEKCNATADDNNSHGTANCNYNLCAPTANVYGDGDVIEYCFADLSDYDYLYIPVAAGTPRVLMNRTEANGQFNSNKELSKLLEMPKDGTWTDAYYTKSDDGKMFTFDIAKIVEENGFAHLNAIKDANWGKVTATDLILYTDPAVAVDEWNQLAAIHESMENTSAWEKKWDFTDVTRNVSSLPGVKIKHRHITSIDLGNNNLTGDFPIAMMSLPYLENLYLRSNHLSGDIGQQMEGYLEQNPTATFPVKNLNFSENQLSGNIGAFAQPLTNLESLNANDNCLEYVNPMISPNVDLAVNNQTINRTLEVSLTGLSGAKLLNTIPNIATYNHDDQSFSTSLIMYWSHDDWAIEYNIEDGILLQPRVFSDDIIYRGQNGDTLEVWCDWNQNILCNIKLFFSSGDANFDGIVDVLDLQNNINHIFDRDDPSFPFNFTAANLWEDEVINVQDVVKLVTLLINTEVDEEEETVDGARATEASAMENAEATVYCRNGQLFINTSRPVATFDITLRSSESVNVLKSLEQAGFTCAVRHDKGSTRIIGYSMKGATLPVGETAIARTTGNTKVIRSVMADSQAQRITVALDNQTTGIAPAVRQSSDERYRLSVGRNGSIVIDRYGNKTFQKKQNQ